MTDNPTPSLQTFMQRVAAGVGMEEWHIVNMAYYDKGVDFAQNYRTGCMLSGCDAALELLGQLS
ncbi:MAG: hypothetical protein AAF787_17765 [Chloroflexota bacterium]